MTTDPAFVNSSKASINRYFERNGDWTEACLLAAEWLNDYVLREYPGKKILLFLADSSSQPDTKVARFKGLSKRKFVTEIISEQTSIVDEGYNEDSEGLRFWCIITVGPDELGKVINLLRSERSSFLYLADTIGYAEYSLEELGAKEPISIDHVHVVREILARDLVPIRVWGQFDDPQVWLELYGNGYNMDS